MSVNWKRRRGDWTLEEQLWDTHKEHPGWSTKKLAQEFGLEWKAVDNALYRLKAEREEHWLDHCRVGFFDLESTNLKANVGHMLCWGLLTTDGTIYSDCITRREIMGSAIEPDRRIVASALRSFDHVDCIVTYNGIHFDVRFLRTRALAHGLSFPAYGQLLHLDLYFAVKGLMSLTSKSMGSASEFLELTPKDRYNLKVWNAARRGSQEALDSIYAHNLSDLHITQDLMIALGPYRKWLRKSI